MNVALVKLSSLGDVVHALPAAATLRARRPDARITWIVERREAAVLAGHPAIDEVVTVDTRAWRRSRGPAGWLAAGRAIASLRARLRAGRFDVAVDLQGLLKSGVLVGMTGAPLRIGFDPRHSREMSALFTNRRIVPAPGRHVVEHYLALVEPVAPGPPVLEFRLPSDPAADAAIDDAFAAAGLKPRDRVAVINPGAGRPDKRWPAERHAAVARRLASDAGARVLVVWGPGEEALGHAIVAGGGAGVLLAPPTDLHRLIAVLRRASVVVAGDTGPIHLAAALGTPCVGIYGPTAAARNGPYGPGHRTLQGPDGRVESVGVDAVAAAAIELLG